jgi:hypothetical protein
MRRRRRPQPASGCYSDFDCSNAYCDATPRRGDRKIEEPAAPRAPLDGADAGRRFALAFDDPVPDPLVRPLSVAQGV